ncbi:hypothetical protein ACOPJQ_06090 [Luteimonas dalianensis]|uniref:hypothetical protein n=1 Tax=Luteimonas dalianensis TaxID=1148196 RepID=UPI003BF09C62
MHRSRSLVSAALALALAAAASTPAAAQDAPAELYIDVATHAMPGMGGMGVLGRLAGGVTGGNAHYGMARHPGMPGRYMDVALHSSARPGAPASQAVPRGLRLGDEIDLLAPAARESSNGGTNGATGGHALADGGPYTIRYYWGCGEQVRSGQPATFTMSVRDGKPVNSGRAMTPRSVPQRGISAGPEYALWPNPSSRRSVSGKASLAGSHQVSGEGVPASMRFDLGPAHDFLPELELERESNDHGTLLSWNGVEGARAYFIHATVMDGDAIVMWSSAADAYAGPELVDFLPESLVAQWTKQGTLLGSDARSCQVPEEVFAAGAPMVQMIAYGNERTITDDSARPGWSVRVRTKSTAMLMPSGVAAPSAREVGEEAAGEGAKGLLRGLFRR